MSVLSHTQHGRGARLVSEAFDATDFARAAVGWDRLRIEAEMEREVEAAQLLWERTGARKPSSLRGCRSYIIFLNRLGEWLRTGAAPRHARRETREPMLAIAEALVRRGQLDPAAMARLQGKPRTPRIPPTRA